MNEQTQIIQPSSGKTKIYLVDDYEIFRTGLRTILKYAGDIEISGESAITPELVDHLEAAETDVLLLGSQPNLSDTIISIKQRLPDLKILVLGTGGDVDSKSIEILDGYIDKDSSSEFLRSAIRTVVLGGTVWQPGLLKSLTAKSINIKSYSELVPTSIDLTPREKQLLVFLAQGQTNKQMSLELQLAQVTVKKELQKLFIKLGAVNRTQAVVKASKLGLT